MKILNILLILLLSACALNANYTDSIDQLNDFDLCFPESGRISIMEINERIACLLYTSDAARRIERCRSRWSPYH